VIGGALQAELRQIIPEVETTISVQQHPSQQATYSDSLLGEVIWCVVVSAGPWHPARKVEVIKGAAAMVGP
jgi:hypothetical protein